MDLVVAYVLVTLINCFPSLADELAVEYVLVTLPPWLMNWRTGYSNRLLSLDPWLMDWLLHMYWLL